MNKIKKSIVKWFALKYRFCPVTPEHVPFLWIPRGEVFWWRNKPYIKESNHIIFDRLPIPRPFSIYETVQVYQFQEPPP